MRDIRFRAWYKEKQEMIKPCDVIFHEERPQVVTDWSGPDAAGHLNQEEFELMQFTGLLDKNGTPVYEGDVLKFTDWDEKPYSGEEKWRESGVGKVKFGRTASHEAEGYTDGWYLELINPKQGMGFFRGLHLKDCEVIGNVHQHKHLLKEAKDE